ncbi:uncharacterized protein LOC124921553 [Impatiens glandulifera]|uniref:uncharacterized protein LOC124921553 n=1 Tax=Impatiens glandulifera TaxID=253017 RepID=UPI001FB183C1|nr:uncharacterized protein LOC124921553 [Impatiens glandulifera]
MNKNQDLLSFPPCIKIHRLSSLRRSSSTNLIGKAQSTISICALFIFFTFLLFALSTFDNPNATATVQPTSAKSWRQIFNFLAPITPNESRTNHIPFALQRLGKIYRRGTDAMHDLIVGHVTELATPQELRLFLRLLHRSGLTSRSDLVLIFPTSSLSSDFDDVIRDENESFDKLLLANVAGNDSETSFNATKFVKQIKNQTEWIEPIWGPRNHSNCSEGSLPEPPLTTTRLSYGSVVSFLVDELDPANSLAGFLDHVPMSLRRWACYPMLLGRLKRKFKNVVLLDVREILLIGDPLVRVKTHSSESVLIFPESTPRKRNPTMESRQEEFKSVNLLVAMGGTRGVRHLSELMLAKIVGAATASRRRKIPVTELAILKRLVTKESLKAANIIIYEDPIPEASTLDNSTSWLMKFRRVSNSSRITSISSIFKQICSIELDSSIYGEC